MAESSGVVTDGARSRESKVSSLAALSGRSTVLQDGDHSDPQFDQVHIATTSAHLRSYGGQICLHI